MLEYTLNTTILLSMNFIWVVGSNKTCLIFFCYYFNLLQNGVFIKMCCVEWTKPDAQKEGSKSLSDFSGNWKAGVCAPVSYSHSH